MTDVSSNNSHLTPEFLLHTEKKRSSILALCIYYGNSNLPLIRPGVARTAKQSVENTKVCAAKYHLIKSESQNLQVHSN